VDWQGNRRLLGKVWRRNEHAPAQSSFLAAEVALDRASLFAEVNSIDLLRISEAGLAINGEPLTTCRFAHGLLAWEGGRGTYRAGEIRFLLDPILRSVELFGTVSPEGSSASLKCYGSSLPAEDAPYSGPALPSWAQAHLAEIVRCHSAQGGLLL
jgi:hypothetical protein